MSGAQTDWMTEWHERVVSHHRAAVERGEHDDQCEFDVQGFYLCHCSKRRREAAGFTKPPTDNLEFPPPCCPRCDEELTHEEGWLCQGCSLFWDSNGAGDSARFTDTHGDDLAGGAERWRGIQLANRPATPKGQDHG
jgi:hypothetical protein